MTQFGPEPDKRPDVWPWNARRDADGQLLINGVGVGELADSFGTPAYVVDLDDLLGRAEVWRCAMDEAFWSGYGMSGAKVYYAGKAFLSKAIARGVERLGLGIDTASDGEFSLALAAGVKPENIGLHGNNKSDDLLEKAIRAGVGRIVVDSVEEIGRVDAVAGALGERARVMVRVTTGVHAGGHHFIATAHEDQKFGLSLATGAALEAVKQIAAAANLDFVGLHSHIGSQITGMEAFKQAVVRLMALRAQVLALGISCDEVDLGGGYAVAYHGGDDKAPSFKEYAEALADAVREACKETKTPVPHVSIEPGRSIAAPSTVTLYRVGTIKDVVLENGGTRRYVSVDGGMSDNIRPALYGAVYTCVRANRVNVNRDGSEPSVDCRIVGSHCESGDIVIDSVLLPDDLCRGDILAVPVTGAYGKTMASNYNMLPTPPVVRVAGGKAALMVRGLRVENLIDLDVS